jgi:hypothetical protein
MLSSTRSGKGKKRINRPFEVRIDGLRRGAFEEVRDAITSAQIAQQEHPSALIAVADRLTGSLVAQLAF